MKTTERTFAQAPVKLAPPGAGLPFLEWFLARFWFVPRLSARMSWTESEVFFQREGRRLLELHEQVPPDLRQTPVLVPRLPGIEDSSRFWSAAMVLEHLIIVGSQVRNLIGALADGRSPTGIAADVAAVKPSGDGDAQSVEREFRRFLEEQANALGAIGEKACASRARFRHPWFGMLTARQWHWLMGAHMRIHRRQLERIVAGLPGTEP